MRRGGRAPLAGAATAQAATSAPHTLTSSWTSLALKNGWTDYGNGTAGPAVINISGIVHLKGAIATNGTNQVPFTLPVGDRRATPVVVPVDLGGGATAGELDILSSGKVFVIPEQSWSDAQAFTSLDGASFATSGSSFTKLTLQNGWTNNGSGFAGPAVRSISGIVLLEGAMHNSTNPPNPEVFILPAGFRPTHNVWVSVDMNNANRGHILIAPNGQVTVFPEANIWSNAAAFTSLDGASFAV